MRNMQCNFVPNLRGTKKKDRLKKIQEWEFLKEISDDFSNYREYQWKIGNTIGSVQQNIINIYNSDYKRSSPRRDTKEQFPVLYKAYWNPIDESDFIRNHVSIHKWIYLKEAFMSDNTNLDYLDSGILKNFISHISSKYIKTGERRTERFSYPILDLCISSLICGIHDGNGSIELTYVYLYDHIDILEETLQYLQTLKVKNTIDLECLINLIKIKIQVHSIFQKPHA